MLGPRAHPHQRRRDSISAVVRDAKGQSLELKAMLKRKSDPWDREVEFQREALRRVYLQVIFDSSSPSTSASLPTSSASSHKARLLEVLNLLWLDTSHALIHVYRAKVAEMDKLIADAPNAHRGHASATRGARGAVPGSGPGAGAGPIQRAHNVPGPTARRRLIHSFRAFLGAEEDFFRALLARLATSLYPADLAGLRALGVQVETNDDQDQDQDRNDDGEPDSSGEPASADDLAQRRAAAVPLAHKALVCFGDLARYRELYSEPGAGNPHAGAQPRTDSGGKKGGRGKGDGERKTKNWSRAAECYHQARLLLPDNGNPSNQLAVLSQYAGDHVSSTYHYYRALSVRIPFPTARTNLEITYAKAVAKWFADGGSGGPDGEDDGIKFRTALVALQGLYFTKSRLADIPALSTRVQELFRASVEQRLLPSDLIVKTVVAGLCALWDARMFRSAGRKAPRDDPTRRSHHDSDASPPSPAVNIEPHLLLHVLSLYRILLEVGAAETAELVASNAAAEVDPTNLALQISAVLRRALPALRILSKWLMGQLDYVSRVEQRVQSKEKKQRDALAAASPGAPSPSPDDLVRLTDLRAALRGFWAAYVLFSNTLQAAFPIELLPSAADGEVWLEEDVDMLGFAPLRRGMKRDAPAEIARVGKDVHPNEEQLMRIGDVLADARLVAASDTSAIQIVDESFVVSPSAEFDSPEAIEARELALATQQLSTAFGLGAPDECDEFDGDYAMTEDDPVDLAMRIATADRMEMDDVDEDDDDDDEIVFRPSLSLSSSQIMQHQSLLPPLASAPPGLPRNAGALLHQIMGASTVSHSPSSYSPTKASPPVAARSIWAPTGPPSSPLPAPVHASAVGSFESLPNTTHQASGPTGAAFARQPSFSSPAVPLPQPTPTAAIGLARSPTLFGNFSPFAATPVRPLPIPASFAAPQPSDLSPHASVFSRSPQRKAYGPGAAEAPALETGWPDMSTLAQQQAVLPGPPPGLLFGRPFSHG